jgi:hypothetical protein
MNTSESEDYLVQARELAKALRKAAYAGSLPHGQEAWQTYFLLIGLDHLSGTRFKPTNTSGDGITVHYRSDPSADDEFVYLAFCNACRAYARKEGGRPRPLYAGWTSRLEQRMTEHYKQSLWWTFADVIFVYPLGSTAKQFEPAFIAGLQPEFNSVGIEEPFKQTIKPRQLYHVCCGEPVLDVVAAHLRPNASDQDDIAAPLKTLEEANRALLKAIFVE